MKNIENKREKMILEQLINRGIVNNNVLNAIRIVPRELFVPENQKDFAYNDCALPIGYGQTISQPYMVAYMTQLAKLNESDIVLEIGTGLGYHSAILSKLAKKVYTIEKIPELGNKAKELLKKLKYNNIEVFIGDGKLGLPKFAPFNAIFVNASTKQAPETLLSQLNKNNGKLLIPLGDNICQTLTLFIRNNNEIEKIETIGCRYVPLV